MKKHLISAVLALSLLICLPLGASAHPMPDESQNPKRIFFDRKVKAISEIGQQLS